MNDEKPREPWRRMDDESAKAFQAFAIYRDLGVDRSLAKVASQLGKNRELIERWANRHGWVSRIKAYDDYLDEIHLYEIEVSRREMMQRQTRLSMYLQSITVRKIEETIERFEDIDEDEPVKRTELVRMLKDLASVLTAATTMERDARGEPNLRIDDLSRPKELITKIVHTDVDGKELDVGEEK